MSASPLAEQVFNGAISYLDNWTAREKKSATFVCGGCIAIAPPTAPIISANYTRRTSPPVRIYWHDRECTRHLVLPMEEENDQNEPFSKIADTLDAEYFSSSFHPADYSILDALNQIILPGVRNHLENQLGFDKFSADLCKLNVSSSHGGSVSSNDFVEKIDAPDNPCQMGHLVVCLSSTFKGGNMLVKSHDKKNVVEFDWSSRSGSNIQWAAFYTDCDYQVEGITEGYRVTLIYRLYITRLFGSSILDSNPIIDPQGLPLYKYFHDLIAQPGFFKHDDGVLGFYCAHYYAHNTEYAHGIFPLRLKGSDMALVAVLLSLDIDVCVCPVIKDYGHETSDDNSPLFGDAMHTVIDVNDYDVRDSIREKIMEKWPSDSHKDEVTWVNDPLHTDDALKILVHARKNSIMTVWSPPLSSWRIFPTGIRELLAYRPMSRNQKKHKDSGLEYSVVNANYIVLDFLATLPQYQRRGAASVLLRWGMEQATERGVGIFLEATMDGYQLYRKRGWKDVYELTMNYDTWGGKGAQTLVLMRKAP